MHAKLPSLQRFKLNAYKMVYFNFTYSKCSKISNTFLFLYSNKRLVFRAGIHKMFVRLANREYPDQTVSSELDLSLHHVGGQLVLEILGNLPYCYLK